MRRTPRRRAARPAKRGHPAAAVGVVAALADDVHHPGLLVRGAVGRQAAESAEGRVLVAALHAGEGGVTHRGERQEEQSFDPLGLLKVGLVLYLSHSPVHVGRGRLLGEWEATPLSLIKEEGRV